MTTLRPSDIKAAKEYALKEWDETCHRDHGGVVQMESSDFRDQLKEAVLFGIAHGRRWDWVSCKERLPKRNENVLVYSTRWGVTRAHLETENHRRQSVAIIWQNDGTGTDILGEYSNITHWMPLPEPPKEVKNE